MLRGRPSFCLLRLLCFEMRQYLRCRCIGLHRGTLSRAIVPDSGKAVTTAIHFLLCMLLCLIANISTYSGAVACCDS